MDFSLWQDMLTQMHLPQKRKAKQKAPYVGDGEDKVLSNPTEIARVQQRMEQQHVKTLKVLSRAERGRGGLRLQ